MGHSVCVEPVTFESFEPPDLADWMDRSKAEYIHDKIRAGDAPEEAKANAEASMEKRFPDGSPAPGHLVGWLIWAGQRIGYLWVGPEGADAQRWWVWDVLLEEPFRGRGLGRQSMLLAEDLAKANGAVTIGLNVFAHNTVARHLYASLAYHETSVQMRKQLTDTL
jgi:GNAT superfamily N-acetyltransferase